MTLRTKPDTGTAKTITVDISDRYPVLIDMDASAFGKIFAGMTDADQVAVLREMVEAMRPHQRQWDFISIELEKPENHELRDILRNVLFPTEGSAK
ncbi:MAG: hypothetical protein ACTHKQ_24785 [Mesorhizobium sp.]